MKRLAVYFAVLVGCLFVGLTTYYMIKNYEIIDVSAVDSSLDAIYLNVGETTNLEITHDLKQTELDFVIENEEIIDFNIENGVITGKNGGETKLIIQSENKNFGDNGEFSFTVRVGDGSETSPFYILNEDNLRAIGTSEQWGVDKNYKIMKDIVLTENWEPLCAENGFSGTLQGNLKTISGMVIEGEYEAAGLFAMVTNLAVVESIKFVNPQITGTFNAVGVVAGINNISTVSKIEIIDADITLLNPYSGNAFVGGVVGASFTGGISLENGENVEDRGIVTMCSFRGDINIDKNENNNNYIDNSIIFSGGIVGYCLGSTIYNTKAEVSFYIDEELANRSKGYRDGIEEENEICIDIGGIVGAVDKVSSTGTYPLIKDNLAKILADNKTTTTNGIIGQLPLDVQFPSGITSGGEGQWVINNYFYTTSNVVDKGGSSVENATTRLENLKDNANFKNWLYGSAISPWIIIEGEEPRINFSGLEAPVGIDQNINELSNENFIEYYEKMTLGSDLSKKYWLRQSYILKEDVTAEINNSIGSGKFMFNGIFDGDGKTLTIKFTGKATETLGLFGQVGPNAEIKNLTININFNGESANYIGAIAGINHGKITDCIVEDINIIGGLYSGGLVGVNYGIISSTKDDIYSNITTSSVDKINSISVENILKRAYAGAIAGINHGTISGIEISGGFKINAKETNNLDVTRYLGGLVGYNAGTLYNSNIGSVSISDFSTIFVYMGGLAGINSGTIELCSTGSTEMASSITGSLATGNQLAGGFAGMITETGTVVKSIANVTIEARLVAGFAPYLMGKVSESYNNGSLKGCEVGGFAIHLALTEGSKVGGIIENCYTKATLFGFDNNSKVAGLAVYMRYPGKIEKCYMAATFAGEGDKYYESFTNTREGFVNWVTSWARPNHKLGTINNVIINTTPSTETANQDVKETKAIVSYGNQVVKYLNEDECKTNIKVFEELGFVINSENSGWIVGSGKTPYLVSIEGLHDIYQDLDNAPTDAE